MQMKPFPLFPDCRL